MRINNLLKKTFLYFIGNAASKCLSALIVPIYAIYVTPDALGTYDYLFTLCTVLYPIFFASIWESILKFGIDRDNSGKIGTVLCTSIKFVLIFSVIASIIQLIACHFLEFGLENSLFLALMTFVTGAATVWQYSARALLHTKVYVTAGVISSCVNFSLIFVLVCLRGEQAAGLVAAYVLGQACIIGYIEMRLHLLRMVLTQSFDIKMLLSMLNYCVPCIFNLISLNLLAGFGRMLIIGTLGAEANGQYAFAMKFASIISSIGSIFTMAVIEEGILRSGTDQLRIFYEQVSNSLIKILLPLACLAIPVITIFYELLARQNYANSYELVPIFVAYGAISVLSTHFGSVFMSFGKTAMNMWTTFVGLAVAILVSIGLISQFGILGVALGLLIGMTTIMITRAAFSVKMLGYHISKQPVVVLGVAYLALTCVMTSLFDTHLLVPQIVVLSIASLLVIPKVLGEARRLSRISDAE